MRGYVRGITFGSSAFSDSDPIGLVRVHFRFVDEHNHEIFGFFFFAVVKWGVTPDTCYDRGIPSFGDFFSE